jgi:hypothetical protein
MTTQRTQSYTPFLATASSVAGVGVRLCAVRNWFHLGPVGDEFGDWQEVYFEDEYWKHDPSVLERPKEVRDLLRTLPRRAKRDALRAMRGSQLRTELYALDQRNPMTNDYVPGQGGRPGYFPQFPRKTARYNELR